MASTDKILKDSNTEASPGVSTESIDLIKGQFIDHSQENQVVTPNKSGKKRKRMSKKVDSWYVKSTQTEGESGIPKIIVAKTNYNNNNNNS